MKKRRRRAILAVLSIVMIFAAQTVYADTYYTVRDANISLDVPDGWIMQEHSAEESTWKSYEHILHSSDVDYNFNLNVYYGLDDAEEYTYSKTSKEEMLDYYEEYGEANIRWFYSEYKQISGVVLQEPEFFEGDSDNFLVVEANVNTKNEEPVDQLIYLTAYMADDGITMVHNLMVFSKGDSSGVTSKEAEIAQKIVNTYCDYDYYNEYAGILDEYENYDEYGEYEEDSDSGFGFVVPLILAVGAFVLKILEQRTKSPSKPKKAKKKSAAINLPFEKKDPRSATQDTAKKKDPGSTVRNILNKKDPRSATHDIAKKTGRKIFTSKNKTDDLQLFADKTPKRNPTKRQSAYAAPKHKSSQTSRTTTAQRKSQYASTAEERYIKSLEVLRKSGLLTKEEMQEMIDKHRRL